MRAFADSAPDRWGRNLIRKAERSRAREEGRVPHRLEVLASAFRSADKRGVIPRASSFRDFSAKGYEKAFNIRPWDTGSNHCQLCAHTGCFDQYIKQYSRCTTTHTNKKSLYSKEKRKIKTIRHTKY